MSRRKRSASTPPQPEFCIDRNLGRSLPVLLTEQGWRLHLMAEEFPNDGQDVADEDWIEYGLKRGWMPLCKDGRIKGRDHERAPLVAHAGVLFYLDNQSLLVEDMFRRIHQSQAVIHRAVARGGPAAYAIGADAIRRTWP